jgi:tetratricopeptide (TPR) repeat protein
MIISHKIDDFLFTIFPELKGGGNSLIVNALEEYYKYGPYKPKVTIQGDWVTIEINIEAISSQQDDYRKTVALCEQGNYQEAKPILLNLIQQNPTNSEYHRILGQILSDEGEQDKAIDCLIDALRWDSKNGYALLLMGNIFIKFKKDVFTAMKYYDQALAVNPNDIITLNNIGGNLLQQGKMEEGKIYFKKALEIDPNYPNSHFAISLISETEGKLLESFDSSITTLKVYKSKDGFYNNVLSHTIEVAKKIIESEDISKTINLYKHKLEFDCDKLIDITVDDNISTAAKFEFAENHNREKHIVKYKSTYKAVEHLVMHELVHLDLATKARKENSNLLFISNQQNNTAFLEKIEDDLNRLKEIGIPEENIKKFADGMFDGLNRQIYNTPIDLFIEDFLFNEFELLRPYQFISLFTLLKEGINAVTDKNIIELAPSEIVSKSKIYNLVNAIQFKVLFGVDLINEFKSTDNELNIANKFYQEYFEFKVEKSPAVEYKLIQNWADILDLNHLFELKDENSYHSKTSSVDSILDDIEKDPYGINTPDPTKEKLQEAFLKNQEEIGTNMAVVMFMVDALEYFQNKSKEETKEIAMEIALLGTQGFNPESKNYRISKIKGKQFSGYHILAYYYVSWAIAIPEMLTELGMPFDNEYKMALILSKTK